MGSIRPSIDSNGTSNAHVSGQEAAPVIAVTRHVRSLSVDRYE